VSDSRGGVVVHVLPHPAAPAENPPETDR
jgi:hypothetical protein